MLHRPKGLGLWKVFDSLRRVARKIRARAARERVPRPGAPRQMHTRALHAARLARRGNARRAMRALRMRAGVTGAIFAGSQRRNVRRISGLSYRRAYHRCSTCHFMSNTYHRSHRRSRRKRNFSTNSIRALIKTVHIVSVSPWSPGFSHALTRAQCNFAGRPLI